jgi:ABC-2 type transport system permease protein
MQGSYKNVLLPGIIAISMVLSGIQAVAMPLIAEFQFTREIEDRLLAPMDTIWLAVEKVVAGMIQALVSGLVVIPAAWLMMGSGVTLSFHAPFQFAAVCFLVALLSAAGGLTLGCSIGQTQIGLMFSLVVAPMMMFGCAYYPWSALSSFKVLQYAVLINPLVYASEGLRGTLTQVDHIPTAVVIAVLAVMDIVLLFAGLNRFNRKAVS